MQDTIIKQNGRSRIIRAPADMPTTYDVWRAQLIAGKAYLDIGLNTSTEEQTAGLEAIGTPLSKATILPDALAGKICAGKEDPTMADALSSLTDTDQQLREAGAALAGEVKVFACTLLADGWTASGTTYTQTAACPGLLAVYDLEAPQVPVVGVRGTDAALKEGLDALCEAGNSGETLDGALKWTCYGSHPEVDLPLRLRRAAADAGEDEDAPPTPGGGSGDDGEGEGQQPGGGQESGPSAPGGEEAADG